MNLILSRTLAVVAIIGGTGMAAGVAVPDRWLAELGISGKEMAGPISPEYNGRSDFAKIFQYDQNAPHFWLAEIQDGNIKVIDDYSSAEPCWKATFTDGPKDGPWRVCIPLDEPAEEFLARVIYGHTHSVDTRAQGR
jgi:hypothetical protein